MLKIEKEQVGELRWGVPQTSSYL